MPVRVDAAEQRSPPAHPRAKLTGANRALKFLGFCILAATMVSVVAAKQIDRDGHAAESNQAPGQTRFGLASYYGKGLQDKKTAGGENFDKNEISAAHPTYPLGTRLRITNLRNGRVCNVRVNDRGPVKKYRRQGVIIDLSERAASELGFRRQGRTRVKTEVLEWGNDKNKPAAADPPA